MMYNTCHCKGCKKHHCVHSVHGGKEYMEQRNTKKTRPRQKDQLTKFSVRALSLLLWWEVRKDDIIILVVT